METGRHAGGVRPSSGLGILRGVAGHLERSSSLFGAAPLHKPFHTVAGLFGNNDLIPPLQKLRMARFIMAGLRDYFSRPLQLDEQTVTEYARRYGIPDRMIGTVLTALTAGLFFLPPNRYSAYAFFGHVGPSLRRLLRFRVGVFVENDRRDVRTVCPRYYAARRAGANQCRSIMLRRAQ